MGHGENAETVQVSRPVEKIFGGLTDNRTCAMPSSDFFVQQMSACWRGRYLSVLVEGSSSCRKTGVSC